MCHWPNFLYLENQSPGSQPAGWTGRSHLGGPLTWVLFLNLRSRVNPNHADGDWVSTKMVLKRLEVNSWSPLIKGKIPTFASAFESESRKAGSLGREGKGADFFYLELFVRWNMLAQLIGAWATLNSWLRGLKQLLQFPSWTRSVRRAPRPGESGPSEKLHFISLALSL